MLRILFSLAFLGHGIGHVIGFSAAWTKVKMGFSNQSWIFSAGINIESGLGRFLSIFWLAALITSVAAGVGLYLRLDWWIPVAIISSVLSIIAVLPWWPAFPSGSYMGAMGFNLLVLVALLGPWADRIQTFLMRG
jgi:hypothetical protein